MDGLGWLTRKRAVLMATFHFSRDEVVNGMSGAEGWVWYACAREMERTLWGDGPVRLSDGYVRQEIRRKMGESEK